jgi:hypothetical protein
MMIFSSLKTISKGENGVLNPSGSLSFRDTNTPSLSSKKIHL